MLPGDPGMLVVRGDADEEPAEPGAESERRIAGTRASGCSPSTTLTSRPLSSGPPWSRPSPTALPTAATVPARGLLPGNAASLQRPGQGRACFCWSRPMSRSLSRAGRRTGPPGVVARRGRTGLILRHSLTPEFSREVLRGPAESAHPLRQATRRRRRKAARHLKHSVPPTQALIRQPKRSVSVGQGTQRGQLPITGANYRSQSQAPEHRS
jgi:hypothetical protein